MSKTGRRCVPIQLLLHRSRSVRFQHKAVIDFHLRRVFTRFAPARSMSGDQPALVGRCCRTAGIWTVQQRRPAGKPMQTRKPIRSQNRAGRRFGNQSGVHPPQCCHGGRVNAASHIRVYSCPFVVKTVMAEIKQLPERERNAAACAKHPALLRQLELEALAALAKNANARIYIGFDKHIVADGVKGEN